ncbi:MAG: multi-sensor signal transduction histidine kinase [uncultured bacterium]|nr:MAG: multi-sensor signal transduction histidine kinase [uncultured bacterium]
MSKILIIYNKEDNNQDSADLLKDVGYDVTVAFSQEEAFKAANELSPDIALVDTSCTEINISNICKKLKLHSKTNDIQIILLTSQDSPSEEVLVGADGYITKPFRDNILIATVNAHLRIKKLLDILYTNNSELAKSLYQLNVLYNTSSQLAGTLDKTKLVSIMNIGLEKSLNFSICLALIINNPEDATLIVNSLYPISGRLEQALKLRAIIGYKSLFENAKLPFELSIDNVKVEKNIKSEEKTYDLPVLEFDSLFSPISTSDQFFGTVEILRESEFSGEDSTCFQTVVKQVSLPLESAILYEEIKKTNIKLEKLEKLKSEFISIVSHELRTPLTSIKNSLDIMLTGKTGEITATQDNFLSIAKRNVDRLSGIINDLLDLSKIEAGKMEYRFKPLNILEPIQFVISTFESLAEKKSIKLSLNIADELPQMYGDINRIEQVLSNLLSNAIKFTPESGEIKISAKKVKADSIDTSLFYKDPSTINLKHQNRLKGDYVKISIEDSGIGINEIDIPKVFDKFQQIESSLSREVGGTGLGLPIAKQLIEAHRGEIWLESEPQKGSTFSFVLPVMMHHSTFLLELDNELQYSKYNHSNLALILLEEHFIDSAQAISSIIKDIAAGKINIIRKGDKCKFFTQDNNMQIIISNTDKVGANNVIKRLKKYLQDNTSQYLNHNLNLGISIYPEEAITSEELIEQAEKSVCKLSNHNKTN